MASTRIMPAQQYQASGDSTVMDRPCLLNRGEISNRRKTGSSHLAAGGMEAEHLVPVALIVGGGSEVAPKLALVREHRPGF